MQGLISRPGKFIIPGRLPGLNEMIDAARSSKYTSAQQKRRHTEDIAWYIKAAKIPHFQKINVIITWYEPNKDRDKDNIHAGVKFIMDALVMAGVIKNDGWRYVGTISHDTQVDKFNPRVEVEILEAIS